MFGLDPAKNHLMSQMRGYVNIKVGANRNKAENYRPTKCMGKQVINNYFQRLLRNNRVKNFPTSTFVEVVVMLLHWTVDDPATIVC